jgi:hypothetical protein
MEVTMNSVRAWAMIAMLAGGAAATSSVAVAAGHGGGGFHGGGVPVLGGALGSRPAVGLGGAVRGGHVSHGGPSFNGRAAFARGGFGGGRGFRGRGRWQGGYAFGWWPGDYELAAYDRGYARDDAEDAERDGPYRVISDEPPACPARYLWNAKTQGFDRKRLCGD